MSAHHRSRNFGHIKPVIIDESQLCNNVIIHATLHLHARPVGVSRWIRTLAIPCPLGLQLRRQIALEHLHDILAQNGEELVAVERPASGEIKPFGSGMRGYDEIGACRERIPCEWLVSRAQCFNVVALDLPADAILVQLPTFTGLSVEDMAGMPDIMLQLLGDNPLVVILLWRWHRDEPSWRNLCGVSEDGLTPPLQLAVRSRRKAADERC